MAQLVPEEKLAPHRAILSLEAWRHNPWHELAGVCILLMEATVIAFWYSSVLSGDHPASFAGALTLFGTIYAAAYAVAQVLNLLDAKMEVRRGAMVLLALGSVWLGLEMLIHFPAFPPIWQMAGRLGTLFNAASGLLSDYWVILLVLVVWQRALSLAGHEIMSESVVERFFWGAMSILLYPFILIMGSLNPFPDQTVMNILYFYVLVGLFGMGAARLGDLNRLRGAKLARFSRGWIISLVASALGVVGISALLAWQMNGVLGTVIAVLLLMVVVLVVVLVMLLALPLGALIALVIGLFKARGVMTLLDLSKVNAFASQLQAWAESDGTKVVDRIFSWASAARPYVLLGVLVLLLVGVAVAVTRVRARQRASETEFGEDLERGSFLDQLGRELRERGQEFLRRFRPRRAEQLIHAARIRWVYSQLMTLCDDLERPRLPAVTPIEFQPGLVELFPNAGGEVAAITSAYLKVRYGQFPENAQEVEVVLQAWGIVNALGKKLKAARRKEKSASAA